MKIRRFHARDIREALKKVREGLGPEAVILANHKVAGGVEIVAAVDYDEAMLHAQADGPASTRPITLPVAVPAPVTMSVPVETGDTLRSLDRLQEDVKGLRGLIEEQLPGIAWGDYARRHPARARILNRLRLSGLHPAVAGDIVNGLEAASHDEALRTARNRLAGRLRDTDDDILAQGGRVALVGPTGVGKTTTAAKLAARFVLRHGAHEVALISADSYRIGAHEQLRAYARILGIPLTCVSSVEALRAALDSFSARKLVLIDHSGFAPGDTRMEQQLTMLQDGLPVRTCLVLSAATQGASNTRAAESWRAARPQAVIVTKLDEACELGGVLSVVLREQLPLAYVCHGQRVPEDLAPARAQALAAACLHHAEVSSADVPYTGGAHAAV